jgi:hypothetical protein
VIAESYANSTGTAQIGKDGASAGTDLSVGSSVGAKFAAGGSLAGVKVVTGGKLSVGL